MRIVGLTGGTGAGKSSAASRFTSHGIPVVDADKIGHALIEPGGAAVSDVLAAFGEGIAAYGKIDRGRLGTLVFGNEAALQRLNQIMQPRIAADIARQCAAFAEADALACIVDAALLGDGGSLEAWMDGLILISSPIADRVERLVTYRGTSREVAEQRIAAQVDPETKRHLATWVVENTGSLDELHHKVDVIAAALLSEDGSIGHAEL